MSETPINSHKAKVSQTGKPLTGTDYLRYKELAENQGAKMFANRLTKNIKHLSRWARKNNIHCYRIYDADIPEYAFAVDYYQGASSDPGDQWLVVQEYQAPKTVNREQALIRTREVMAVLPGVVKVAPGNIHLKVRMRQKGVNQYEKLAAEKKLHKVNDGRVQIWVNFSDYLDTGLFLDHRPIREWLEQQAKGKRFLNLFAYTGSATVHAAAGGAALTVTVDMSNTYLQWARDNMQLNGFAGEQHRYVQSDCLKWLKQEGDLYELIFLDPPSFSTSKRMDNSFDVQRDQQQLIDLAMARLTSDGILVFSNNRQGFKLMSQVMQKYRVEDITRRTIAEDFKRNPRIHQCWLIRH